MKTYNKVKDKSLEIYNVANNFNVNQIKTNTTTIDEIGAVKI